MTALSVAGTQSLTDITCDGIYIAFGGNGEDIRILVKSGTSETLLSTYTTSWTSSQEISLVRSGSTMYLQIDGVTVYTVPSGNFNSSAALKSVWAFSKAATARSFNDCAFRYGATSLKGISADISSATGTLVSTVQTAPEAKTEVSGVILYTDEAGTNTIGTDLKIYLTANLQGTTPNWTGTTWTEAASYGTAQTFSGTTKQVKLGKTTVTSGTAVALKGVWANQVASTAAAAGPVDTSSNSHTLTAVGNATTSTSIIKSGVGTHSMQFDGTGDWYTIPDGTWIDLGTGDFTMEAWIYLTASGSWRAVLGSGNWGGPSTYDFTWDVNGGDNKLRFNVWNGSTETGVNMTTAIVNSTWTHVAAVRSGGTLKQYLNGTANGTTLSSTHDVTSHGVVYIGNQSRGVPWQGNIQEVRISNNARYTSNFTPSTSAFTSDSNTKLLVHGSGTAAVTGKVAQLNGWAVNY